MLYTKHNSSLWLFASFLAVLMAGCNAEPGGVVTPTVISTGTDDANTGKERINRITSQAGIDLGSAGNFAILAGATVTNTGGTIVTGDLGLSPGASVTGFPPGEVRNGAIYAADADGIAEQAKLDLTTAYNEAAGRNEAPIGIQGNIGGQTLAPGLYSAGYLAIEDAALTLDAEGDADAVWVFQMASTLTVISGQEVILSGGAQAKNIYWQVGSSATLGTYSVFKGNILAYASITLGTGATLEGRALTRVAAVTLDANIVTKPAE